MDNILFSSLPSCSTVCWDLRFLGGFVFLFALLHDRFEKWIMNYKWSTFQMSCAKNIIYVALVLHLRRARQQTSVWNYCILKNRKIWRKWMVSHHSSSDDVQSNQKYHRIGKRKQKNKSTREPNTQQTVENLGRELNKMLSIRWLWQIYRAKQEVMFTEMWKKSSMMPLLLAHGWQRIA